MCKRITSCFNFPASVNGNDENPVRRTTESQHNAVIAAGRIFHAGRHIHTTDGKGDVADLQQNGHRQLQERMSER